jgi:hypothetical protein
MTKKIFERIVEVIKKKWIHRLLIQVAKKIFRFFLCMKIPPNKDAIFGVGFPPI